MCPRLVFFTPAGENCTFTAFLFWFDLRGISGCGPQQILIHHENEVQQEVMKCELSRMEAH